MESEVIHARYKAREKEADKLGRVITVRRLNPQERTTILRFTPGLDGSRELRGPNGELWYLPNRTEPQLAAAVCGIDDKLIPFPRTEGELWSILNELDDEGITAALVAMSRLTAGDSDGSGGVDAAKNLSGTLSSESHAGS